MLKQMSRVAFPMLLSVSILAIGQERAPQIGHQSPVVGTPALSEDFESNCRRDAAVLTPPDARATAEAQLKYAILTCDYSLIKRVLHVERDVNACTKGMSPLNEAIQAGNTRAVAILLQFGVEPNGNRVCATLGSPLKGAAWGDNPEIAHLLLGGGANIDEGGTDGDTPLMTAAWTGSLRMLSYLIGFGANTNAVANDGSTAVIRAVQSRHYQALKMLIDAGANLCVRNKDGHSALTIINSYGDNAGGSDFRRVLTAACS